MPTYRKLTSEEVLELASRIRYADELDLDVARAGIRDLFGPTAHKATFHFGTEYDDENHYHRASEVTVWDKAGRPLTRPVDEDDYDEQLSDFFRELSFGETVESDPGLGEITVFVNDTKGLDLPALYIQEPSQP